jgi:HAD superfamily hydrolase (TIGR01509 family)
MLKALIFDVDGTLADTEEAHRAAFNYAFATAGNGWLWDEALYTRLLEISGGKERILHYWKQLQPDFLQAGASVVQDTVDRLHACKTAAYTRAVQEGAVQLRPGVLELIEAANCTGLRLAIATTTTPANISALLQAALGADWARYFDVVEDAATAPMKKPHPQAYLQALARLQLPATACLAFEDSANGLQAAIAAGLPTLVTPNRFTDHHSFKGALQRLPSLERVSVGQLRDWHASALAPA